MEKMKEKNHKESYYDKKPILGEQSGWKIKEHFGKGLTFFLVTLACIGCYFAILRFDLISDLIGQMIDLVMPFVYGIVLAYLLNPIVKMVEKYTLPFLKKYLKNEKTVQKTGRSLGIVCALIVMTVVVTALINMVVPELFRSVSDLIENSPDKIAEWIDWINKIQADNSTVDKILKTALLKGSEALENWIQTDFLRQTNTLMTGITSGVISVVNTVLDVVIGIIVSVYALFSKEQFLNQGRKVIYAFLTPKKANLTLHVMRKSNEIFGGFIIGKIIDSAIIGVLCFIGVSLLKMPYALLVSVFVGVTNVIPYFGPFIGAIPMAILITIVDPIKGLYFIIFIFLLQQFDGNILGPTILGDTTGLSAFWVLFSILLFGGLFGVVGMIIGVPTFAVFYYIVKLFINHKLEGKHLPTETICYDGENYVDNDGVYIEAKNKLEKGE